LQQHFIGQIEKKMRKEAELYLRRQFGGAALQKAVLVFFSFVVVEPSREAGERMRG